MRLSTTLVLACVTAFTAANMKTNSQAPLFQTHRKDYAETVRKALNKSSIIPEVLDDFSPTCFITPYYSKNSGKTHKGPVDLGNKFKPKQTKERPGFSVNCPKKLKTPGLVVALTDPDAKSREDPKWSEMCHWIYIIPTHFPSNSQESLEFSIPSSDHPDLDLVEYKPPGPPPKTGYHRYVFVVLEGDTTNLTAPDERQHWGTGKVRHGVRDWAEKEDLQVVGANWFVERDEKQ
ncbi:putative carboxypeptidase Y inhibitor [Cadophora sp. MPI-SDFR-AT-0126]|nr:putative carboxypeptidase Y inhibitor [Leotiomycetes sp. MPI-SDFR-AT-0126]